MYTYTINNFIWLFLITTASDYLHYLEQLIGILFRGESGSLEGLMRVCCALMSQ